MNHLLFAFFAGAYFTVMVLVSGLILYITGKKIYHQWKLRKRHKRLNKFKVIKGGKRE